MGTVRLLDAALDHRNDQVVGHQPAFRHDALDLLPQRTSRRDFGPKHVARGNLGDSIPFFQPLGLGALSGARRSEKNNIQRILPFLPRPLRMSP